MDWVERHVEDIRTGWSALKYPSEKCARSGESEFICYHQERIAIHATEEFHVFVWEATGTQNLEHCSVIDRVEGVLDVKVQTDGDGIAFARPAKETLQLRDLSLRTAVCSEAFLLLGYNLVVFQSASEVMIDCFREDYKLGAWLANWPIISDSD
jgi:hypothetical protein